MANFPDLYNAVIAGIAAGYQIRRAPVNTTDFVALATAVDSALAGSDAPTKRQIDLMRGICQGIFSRQRYTLESSNRLTNAIVSLYLSMNQSLEFVPTNDGSANILPGNTIGQTLIWDDNDQQYIPGSALPIPSYSATDATESEAPKVTFQQSIGFVALTIDADVDIPTPEAGSLHLATATSGVHMHVNVDDINPEPLPIGNPPVLFEIPNARFELRNRHITFGVGDNDDFDYSSYTGIIMRLNRNRGFTFFDPPTGDGNHDGSTVFTNTLNLNPPNINNSTTLNWVLRNIGLIDFTPGPFL